MATDKEWLMLKIFHDYYVRNLSQSEIASRHFISRPKVQRYLEQGRKENLVEVRIRFPGRIHGVLESELEDKFGLLEVMVADVDANCDLAMARREIAEFAADYFLRVLSTDMIIAVCWSTFIEEMVEQIGRKYDDLREKPKGVDIVQSLGVIVGDDMDSQIFDVPRRLASIINGRARFIMAPGIAGSADAHQVLINDPQIADVLKLARKSDAAFFGVGSVGGESHLMRRIRRIFPGVPEKLRENGVVGDLNGRFYDIDGNEVESELDERVIGISLSEIRSLPLSVAVTGGPGKHEALRGALASGCMKVLITDLNNAKKLMEEGVPGLNVKAKTKSKRKKKG